MKKKINGGTSRDFGENPWKFSVSEDDVCRNFYYKNVSKSPNQSQIQRLLSQLPLFVSFFDKPNAKYYKSYAKYSKNDFKEQWQAFEKITCETGRKNIFADIAENFGDKLINSFFMGHVGFLSKIKI